jgi:hypothetical protein
VRCEHEHALPGCRSRGLSYHGNRSLGLAHARPSRRPGSACSSRRRRSARRSSCSHARGSSCLAGLAVAASAEALLASRSSRARPEAASSRPRRTSRASSSAARVAASRGRSSAGRRSVPVALLAAAPFRISTSVGTQNAYLLDPLYVVLAALWSHSSCARSEDDDRRCRGCSRSRRAFVFYTGSRCSGRATLRAGQHRAALLPLPVLRARRRRRARRRGALASARARGHARRARGALLGGRALPAADARALARQRRRARERVHDRTSASRRCSRTRASSAVTS